MQFNHQQDDTGNALREAAIGILAIITLGLVVTLIAFAA